MTKIMTNHDPFLIPIRPTSPNFCFECKFMNPYYGNIHSFYTGEFIPDGLKLDWIQSCDGLDEECTNSLKENSEITVDGCS